MAAKLTQSGVRSTLFRMAYPMLAGTIAINAYNFADTWFVSRLGTVPLAAMGLTFPVVMLLSFVAGGIGTGVTALTSHAIGRGDHDAASRTVTHGIALVALLSAALAVGGYLSMNPVFRAIGATSQTLPLVRSYMGIWYLGAVFMAIPMMGNGILISLGDSKHASMFMLAGAALNCVLDPVMIFGLLGMPALGISGAALATVLAQAVSASWLFYLLAVKHRLLAPSKLKLRPFLHTSRRIVTFAVPASLSMVLMPVSSAVITALVSRHGTAALAAVSAAGRIEMLAFVVPMALGMSLMPFISQNFGAGRFDRIHEAKRYSTRFAVLYGACIAAVFFVTAPLLARVFTHEPAVERLFTLYVRIIAFGYGMMEVHRYCGFILTGVHRPAFATALNATRVLAFLVPFSLLGNHFFGMRGLFVARLATDLLAGTLGLTWVTWLLRSGHLAQAPAPGTGAAHSGPAEDGRGPAAFTALSGD